MVTRWLAASTPAAPCRERPVLRLLVLERRSGAHAASLKSFK
jgi:hypothetical protein